MPNIKPVILLAITDAKKETLSNKIKTYSFNIKKKIYIKLVVKFVLLWKDDKFIKVPFKK